MGNPVYINRICHLLIFYLKKAASWPSLNTSILDTSLMRQILKYGHMSEIRNQINKIESRQTGYFILAVNVGYLTKTVDTFHL